ncbi:hypothetical protein C8R47DRAFT_1231840 [Mycena vitilis]|nr:hypothetical protein C8R47DRAFT_1231840 [Mycena vitilis]
MQINIYLQEGGATAGATESLKTITWVLLLAILAGIAMAGVNRQPAHPAIRRGRRGNYPVGNPVLQTLRGLIHRTGLLLLRVGRPQAQPGHPRCGHKRGPHPRGNNPRRILIRDNSTSHGSTKKSTSSHFKKEVRNKNNKYTTRVGGTNFACVRGRASGWRAPGMTTSPGLSLCGPSTRRSRPNSPTAPPRPEFPACKREIARGRHRAGSRALRKNAPRLGPRSPQANRTASGGGEPPRTRRTRSPPHYSGGLSTPPPSTRALRGQESDLKTPVAKAAEPVRPPDRSPGGRPPTPKEKSWGNRDYSTKTGWTGNETRVSVPAPALRRGSHPRVAYKNAGCSAAAGNDPGRREHGVRRIRRKNDKRKLTQSTQVRQSTVGVQELVHPVPKVLPVLELEGTQRDLVLIRVRSVELAPRLARLVLAKAPLASATRLVGLPLVGIRVVGAESSRPTPPTGRQRIRLRGGDLDLRASGGNQRGWRGGCARPLDAGDRRGYRRDDGATGERRGRGFPQEPASGMGGGDALPAGDRLLRTWGRTSSSSSSDSTRARCRFLDGILILKGDGRGLAGGSEMKSSSTSIASPAPARGSLGTTGEVGDGTRGGTGDGDGVGHRMRILPLFQHKGVEFSALQNRRRERIVGGFFSPRDPRTRAVEADLSKNYGQTSGTRSNGAKRRIRTVKKLRHPDALEHIRLVGGQPVVIDTGVHPVRRDGSHPGYWLAQVGHHIRDVVTHEELAAEASQLVPTLHLGGLGVLSAHRAIENLQIIVRKPDVGADLRQPAQVALEEQLERRRDTRQTKDKGFCLCRRVPLEDLHGGGRDVHLVDEFARQIAHRRVGGIPRNELAEDVVVPAWAARPEHANGSIPRPDDLQKIPAHHDVNQANLVGDVGEGDRLVFREIAEKATPGPLTMADIAMAGRFQPVAREGLAAQGPANQVRVIPEGRRRLGNSRTVNPRIPDRRGVCRKNRASETRVGDTPPVLAKEREATRFRVGGLLARHRAGYVQVRRERRWPPSVPGKREIRVEVYKAEIQTPSWRVLGRRRGRHEEGRGKRLAGRLRHGGRKEREGCNDIPAPRVIQDAIELDRGARKPQLRGVDSS